MTQSEPASPRRLLAIVTDPIESEGPLGELSGAGEGPPPQVQVVVPAVEETAFRHTMGDVDGPVRRAERTLEDTLRALREHGVEASGAVGDSDPVLAAEDALRDQPVDEVLIFEHAASQARWFENGLFERAQESLAPPLRIVVVERDPGESAPGHVVAVESAGRGIADPPEEHDVGTAYLPGLSRSDFAGMLAGVLGTIVIIVLAAAATAEASTPTGWAAAAIGIAIFATLVNMAHVVGLFLFESVRYRGGFARFFRTLSLLGTPIAVVVNLLILVLS